MVVMSGIVSSSKSQIALSLDTCMQISPSTEVYDFFGRFSGSWTRRQSLYPGSAWLGLKRKARALEDLARASALGGYWH